jgi:sirohydrochlorin ferrochelatase
MPGKSWGSSGRKRRRAYAWSVGPRRSTPAGGEALEALIAQAEAARGAQRPRAEALLERVRRGRAELRAGFFDAGMALTELLEQRLYLALDHRSFAGMLAGQRLMSQTAATRLIAVARVLPRSTALQLGPERAFEWLRLLRLRAGPRADVGVLRRMACASPEVDGRPVEVMSTRDLAALRRALQARRDAARRDPASIAALRATRALVAYLRRRGAGDARVVSRRTRGGWHVRIDLPLPSAEALVRSES